MLERDTFLLFFKNEIFEQIKALKNNLDGKDLFPFINCVKEYELLNAKLNDETKEAICKILYEILESYTHNVMVMFDNGTYLSDTFLIDIINAETRKSLTESVDSTLHEDFIDIMLNE